MLLRAARNATGRAVLTRPALSTGRRWASAETGVSKIDPFEVFENRVGPDSGDKEIKEVYRDLVKEYHPDSNPDADPKKITEINEAYRMLIKMSIKGKLKNRMFTQGGDEPPVPRSELQDRVYKPADQKWEESTQLLEFKIKKRYGTLAFWLARFLFTIVQIIRPFKVLIIIMVMMAVVQSIRSQVGSWHMEEARKAQRTRMLQQAGQDPEIKLTKI
eukprot:TRINITY_DN32441_c0_g1_i1.p2 TRINITY_DN32441_c0_g1~~TRINITY_DN32441_c0_g1_i1.p2  ORF type:complete len:232 (+),score=111.07 TRINITY_DN32441_c0_g1_i1:48-698(+)